LLGSRVEVARGKTAAVAFPLAAAVKATEYERKPHLPGIRNTAETGAIKRGVIMGALVQIKPALRIITGRSYRRPDLVSLRPQPFRSRAARVPRRLAGGNSSWGFRSNSCRRPGGAVKVYETNQKRFAIILAGGDGTRLSELTRRISGDATPKQFCPVLSNISLLEQTRLRVSRAVGENQILTVLTRAHERHYRDLVNEILPENLVIQPASRGTAPAILYALLRLSEVARDADVAVFPSDHFVSDDREFMRHVDLAFDAVGSRPEMTALLGIRPDAVESGYGWIEPGELVARCAPLFRVRGFWEKPTGEVAGELLRAGCMWNSFVMVARVSTLIGMIMVALHELFASFSKIRELMGTSRESGGLERLYERIPIASFSDKVLERHPINIGVLPVHSIGWSDLGEPQRVMAVLSRLGVHPEWKVA
jgi:mannose-1-phosphate guanylyltransferase